MAGTTFKENNFCVIRNTLSEEMTSFMCEYFTNKDKIFKTMSEYNYINPHNREKGSYHDPQALGSYSLYGDIITDMLLVKLKSVIQQHTEKNLSEQYSYLRVYKNGAVLEKHKDRSSCEISTTLNLGGDKIWPIFLTNENQTYKVLLNPGDLLVYRGCELEHWREKFDGQICVQTFLHYMDKDSKEYGGQHYDSRPDLGLPAWFRHR